MTDAMNIRVRLRDEEFVVPCAEGDQNIKWLALAAVRLYSALHQHKYCLRQRERLVSESGFVLPHSVRLAGTSEDLDPNDTINETLEDGELVEVGVQKTIKLGRNGIPEPSEFHAKAFLTSELIHERLENRLATEERKRQDQLAAEEARRAEADARIFGSIDQETKEAFQAEFQKIVDKRMVLEDDQDDLKETLARYFEEVDALFKHFSGFYVGEPSVMAWSSFVHTVHKTRVLDITNKASDSRGSGGALAVKRILQDSRIDMNKALYPDGALTRGNFTELLVRLAMLKNDDLSAADAFDALMQEFILPYLDTCRLTDIQQTLESQDTVEISRTHFARLQRTFCRYVHSQSKSSQKYGPGAITEPEFRQLLRDAAIIPKPRKGTSNSSKKATTGSIDEDETLLVEEEVFARQAFQEAQKDTQTQKDLPELNELTFPEFVEALMWFGMLWHSARSDYMDHKHMSLAKRTEAYEMLVTDIVHHQSQAATAAQLSAGQATGKEKKGKGKAK